MPTSDQFRYPKAQAQQEAGGETWRVVTDLRKAWNGAVVWVCFEEHLPNKARATRLSHFLNGLAKLQPR